MIMAVDIGNTNTKIGVFENNKIINTLRVSNSFVKTSDEYGFYIKNILTEQGIDLSKIDGAIMSSVNPNYNYTFEHMLSSHFKVKPLIVGAGIKTGIKIKYDNPKELGSDRIMDCVGAWHNYGGDCIVVDCGTATTFNVLSAKGEFLGGLISFGLKSGSDALSSSAAKLPKVELVRPMVTVGKNTIANMQSGIILGYTGMIEYIIGKIREEMGVNYRVIATGGLSQVVADCSKVFDVVDRSLTLKGLCIAYNLNRPE